MRRVPIRTKLAGALTVPLLALATVTAAEVAESAADAERARDQNELAEATIGPLSLLTSLEVERNAAAVYLLGQEESFALPVEDNAEARVNTDTSVADLRAQVARSGGLVAAAYQPALDQLDGVRQLRAEIDAFTAPRGLGNIGPVSDYFDRYTGLMDELFSANRRVALAVDDPELRRGAQLIDVAVRQTNLIAILVRDLLLAEVGGDAPNGLDTPAEIAAVAAPLSAMRSNEQLIRSTSVGAYRPLAADLFAAPETEAFNQAVSGAIASGRADLDAVITHSSGVDPDTYGYTVFKQSVATALSDRADELQAAADARQRWYVALLIAVLVVAGLVTFLVSRSITRPLRSLTRQAKDMAERRLPHAVSNILETPLGDDVTVPAVEPVVVRTRDEVADVAATLNTVQDTALDLAVEQAVLRRNIADSFVNLGRRNQNLLGRQLDFITQLESNETDPDVLANLFRLDHLATRMRRNAESLLVLAGIAPPRQWAAPVPVTDVIRAALGEVENFQRVVVRSVEPATVMGSAAADLAHLLAELVENALVFSPPDLAVEIRGHPSTGGYTLAVIDAGLGMPHADLVAANRRLAGAESFTIAPSRYLGHYVAGNLAARHDIGITLHGQTGRGVVATIEVPSTVLSPAAPVVATTSPFPPGRLSRGHSPRALAPTTPDAPGQAERTLAQLARRPTHPPAASQPGPNAPPHLAPPLSPGAARRSGDGPPPPEPEPEPLARRVPGAQPPDGHVVPLHPPDPAPAPHTPADADALHSLVVRFTAGVQRGMDELRRSRS